LGVVEGQKVQEEQWELVVVQEVVPWALVGQLGVVAVPWALVGQLGVVAVPWALVGQLGVLAVSWVLVGPWVVQEGQKALVVVLMELKVALAVLLALMVELKVAQAVRQSCLLLQYWVYAWQPLGSQNARHWIG
jgi:hypothetical protein